MVTLPSSVPGNLSSESFHSCKVGHMQTCASCGKRCGVLVRHPLVAESCEKFWQGVGLGLDVRLWRVELPRLLFLYEDHGSQQMGKIAGTC